MTPFDAEFLGKFPDLQAVFYAAGSIRQLARPEFWARDVEITTAREANGQCVAEYCLGAIMLSLKGFWGFAAATRDGYYRDANIPFSGTFRSTVGLVSLGTIGRLVIERLRGFDVNIVAFDPFLTDDEADRLGIESIDLPGLFERADVVSVHTPWLRETERMLDAQLLNRMKAGSTLINSARGAVIDEPAMCEFLRQRSDVWAVLDVTYPEPPALDSPLRSLPNVVLTPHIAGATGAERRRLGAAMVDELRRYLSGEPLKWRVSREMAEIMA
jgi:phosphoglycerate dehydrogenase-like enzyme